MSGVPTENDGKGQLSWTVESDGDTARLSLQGELDLHETERLRGELERVQAGADRLELDLSDLTFIDSSGIRLLLRAATHPARPSGRVTLAAVSEPVKRTMDALGLLEFFRRGDK
jgi:anti-anti-sigma factor